MAKPASAASMEAIKKQWEKDETLAAYEITKQLGEGAYGVVVAAKVRATQEKVAVKKIRDAVEDKEQGKLLLRELKLLRHFRGHENVVYIKEIIESPKVCNLQFPTVEDGSVTLDFAGTKQIQGYLHYYRSDGYRSASHNQINSTVVR
jgi:serine/threonine protein kinase